MKTETELLTEIALSEIICPCEEACITRPPTYTLGENAVEHWRRTNPSARDYRFYHSTFQQYIECLSKFVQEFVRSQVRILRARDMRSQKLPLEIWRIMDDNRSSIIFIEPIKALRIHFASCKRELDDLLTRNFISICALAVSQASKK